MAFLDIKLIEIYNAVVFTVMNNKFILLVALNRRSIIVKIFVFILFCFRKFFFITIATVTFFYYFIYAAISQTG